MIEVIISRDELGRIQHNVTHSIRMIEALKAAGIPIDGVLITHGISRGTMEWSRDEDLDADNWVIRWWDEGEKRHTRGTLKASGHGVGYTWRRFLGYGEVMEDDEL